jgi:hypothetical protein
MFFRLLALNYLSDIEELVYTFLSSVKGSDLQRVDVYIDYNGQEYWKPQFRKNAKIEKKIFEEN